MSERDRDAEYTRALARVRGLLLAHAALTDVLNAAVEDVVAAAAASDPPRPPPSESGLYPKQAGLSRPGQRRLSSAGIERQIRARWSRASTAEQRAAALQMFRDAEAGASSRTTRASGSTRSPGERAQRRAARGRPARMKRITLVRILAQLDKMPAFSPRRMRAELLVVRGIARAEARERARKPASARGLSCARSTGLERQGATSAFARSSPRRARAPTDLTIGARRSHAV